jgi:hypothetical protein
MRTLARHVPGLFSSENSSALPELSRCRSCSGMNDPVRFEMRLPRPLRDKLERAAAAGDRSIGSMARQLIAKGLNDPLDGAEAATYGNDAVRSPITGVPYQSGSGALSREAQDKLVAAEQVAGRRLSEFEAQRLLNRDNLQAAVEDAVGSIDEVVK